MRMKTTAFALAGAIAAAAAIPALGGAQSGTGARDITVQMKVRGGAEVKHGKGRGDKLATGDRLLIRLSMFSPAGEAVGSAYTDCVNVGRRAPSFHARLQCTQTYQFADGQIVVAGVVRFSQLDDLSIPIVGGSGAYRGASGELVAGPPAEGFESVDVLRLDG